MTFASRFRRARHRSRCLSVRGVTPVDKLGVQGTTKGEYVCFDGDKKLGGRVWELAKHRLTANDYNLVCPWDRGCGANDMFKLRTFHDGAVS